MSRSTKKGAYVEDSLYKKVEALNASGDKQVIMTEESMFLYMLQRIWLDTSSVNLHRQEHSEAMPAQRHLSNRKENYYGSNS